MLGLLFTIMIKKRTQEFQGIALSRGFSGEILAVFGQENSAIED